MPEDDILHSHRGENLKSYCYLNVHVSVGLKTLLQLYIDHAPQLTATDFVYLL
jgi:hypothetical protein